MRAILKSTLVPLLTGLLLSAAANAQVSVAPFFPTLPATATLAPEIAADVSKKGYHVAEINRSGTYVITDGGYQAWAIVTQRGVILVDAPDIAVRQTEVAPMAIVALTDPKVSSVPSSNSSASTLLIQSHP